MHIKKQEDYFAANIFLLYSVYCQEKGK